MKHLLLGCSALAVLTMTGLAVGATPAAAQEPIRLTVGGFFKSAYMVVFDDDGEGELGNERNTDGFFSDAEIFFTGSTVLDNGLEVGARVELEGETDSDGEGGDQIDEAWIWFSGGFGEVRIGSDDEALANACIVPPGGTGNFSAFSPNQWGANTFSSNTVCTGVDDASDAQKIIYISPNFAGLQLTVSYTPESNAETHDTDGGPHLGMPGHFGSNSRHNASVYLTYQYEGDGWGLTWGGGASFEGHREKPADITDPKEQDFYQTGLNLSFGNFAIGVVGEYFHHTQSFEFRTIEPDQTSEAWSAGIGASYEYDAWTFGAQYSHLDVEIDNIDSFENIDQDTEIDRAVVTAVYALGPGIQVDGEIAYTWGDVNENEGELSNYDAVEIGIGTTLTF